jgi:hypothetical protein
MGSGNVRPVAERASLFERLEKLNASDRDTLRALWNESAQRFTRKGASAQETQAADNLSQLSALLDRMGKTSPMKVEKWSDAAEEQQLAVEMQRALWLFEHDLTAGVYLRHSVSGFDSHTFNYRTQLHYTEMFAKVFARFLSELERRKSPTGPLQAQTAICVGSELGRHPRLNSDFGKDHFPEVAFLFAGPAFANAGKGWASFGATGSQMESLPLDIATGLPRKSGTYITLDDVGATLLTLSGIDPTRRGYLGRRLPFLSPA